MTPLTGGPPAKGAAQPDTLGSFGSLPEANTKQDQSGRDLGSFGALPDANMGAKAIGAADAGLTHAGVAATYGFAKDVVPAMAYALGQIPGAYKLFKDPATGKPRESPPDFQTLHDEWTGELARQEQEHPVASGVGTVAGAMASPLNKLMPGGTGVIGGAVGGGTSSAAQAFGNTEGDLGTRLGAAAKAAPVGALTGGVLGGVTQALRAPLLSQEIADRIKGGEDETSAAYKALGNQPAIHDPDIVADANQFAQIPRYRKAYESGQEIASVRRDPIPDLPQTPGRANTGAPSPEVVDRIRADNPTWSETTVQNAAQDPTIVRALYGGPGGGPFSSITPKQINYWKQGIDEEIAKSYGKGPSPEGTNKIGPQVAGGMRDEFKKFLDKVDRQVPDFPAARQSAARGFALQEAGDALETPADHVGQMASLATKAARATSLPGMVHFAVPLMAGNNGMASGRALDALKAATRAVSSGSQGLAGRVISPGSVAGAAGAAPTVLEMLQNAQ